MVEESFPVTLRALEVASEDLADDPEGLSVLDLYFAALVGNRAGRMAERVRGEYN